MKEDGGSKKIIEGKERYYSTTMKDWRKLDLSLRSKGVFIQS